MNTAGQMPAGFISDTTLYLYPVALPELAFWIGYALLQIAVAREDQEPFRIVI
jgi:hypothetical protein